MIASAEIIDISYLRLSAVYLLLVIPLSIMLWTKISLVGKTLLAAVRMTVQLLFVGFYLQVVFEYNDPRLNAAWVIIMIIIADVSIVRHCEFKLRFFMFPMFFSLLIGTAVPLLFFVGPILQRPGWLDARFVIPIGGMILGNCLRADVIGIGSFYKSIKDSRKAFLQNLSYGATLHEAAMPYFQQAFQLALKPTVATMSTIGLVSLPGMMTGVILGGADPINAIKYQIAIMISIFTGTAITVYLAIMMTMRSAFDSFGILDNRIFKN